MTTILDPTRARDVANLVRKHMGIEIFSKLQASNLTHSLTGLGGLSFDAQVPVAGADSLESVRFKVELNSHLLYDLSLTTQDGTSHLYMAHVEGPLLALAFDFFLANPATLMELVGDGTAV